MEPDPNIAEPIEAFRGAFAFLSNFYEHPLEIEGAIYPTAEHAFQALKTLDPKEREHVRSAPTPAAAPPKALAAPGAESSVPSQQHAEIYRACPDWHSGMTIMDKYQALRDAAINGKSYVLDTGDIIERRLILSTIPR